MAVRSEYDLLKGALSEVNFEGKTPWEKWTPKDVKAIKAMFPYNHQGNGEVDDGFDGDRQSNMEGGRLLFAVSQSKANPYRFSRLKAYNGTYVPVIALDLLRKEFCATLGQFLNVIRHNYQQPVRLWPQQLNDLWRDEPHGNWNGDLPERQLSEGERAWYRGRRDQHPYSMNEWQIHHNKVSVYPFDQSLATDPGAIRIVSVSAQRFLGSQHWNIDYGAAGVEPPVKHKAEMDGGVGSAKYYDSGDKYTRAEVKREQGHTFGASPGDNKKKYRQADLKERLYRRKPLRFYFSFNHYRPVVVRTKQGGEFVLNPWVAIAED